MNVDMLAKLCLQERHSCAQKNKYEDIKAPFTVHFLLNWRKYTGALEIEAAGIYIMQELGI